MKQVFNSSGYPAASARASTNISSTSRPSRRVCAHDDGKRVAVFVLVAMRLRERDVCGRPRRGHRRAQLVRRVGHELALGGDAGRDSFEQAVEGAAQLGDFIVAGAAGEPRIERLQRDSFRLGAHLADRPQRTRRRPPADDRGEDQRGRRDDRDHALEQVLLVDPQILRRRQRRRRTAPRASPRAGCARATARRPASRSPSADPPGAAAWCRRESRASVRQPVVRRRRESRSSDSARLSLAAFFPPRRRFPCRAPVRPASTSTPSPPASSARRRTCDRLMRFSRTSRLALNPTMN